MSKSINQVLIMGNVGKEPEIKVLDNQVKVATFSVATSTGGFKKADGTEVQEKTSWHSIVAWRGLAELSEKFVHKGDKVLIQGTLSYREYEKDGVKRYLTDIIAYDIVLCGKTDGAKPQIGINDMPSQEEFPPTVNYSDRLPF